MNRNSLVNVQRVGFGDFVVACPLGAGATEGAAPASDPRDGCRDVECRIGARFFRSCKEADVNTGSGSEDAVEAEGFDCDFGSDRCNCAFGVLVGSCVEDEAATFDRVSCRAVCAAHKEEGGDATFDCRPSSRRS